MAPSLIRSDDSRREALATRDERQVALDRWRGVGVTLVSVSLAIPGPVKTPPGAVALYAWAVDQLRSAFPAARRVYLTKDALGPFDLWTTPGDATIVKRRCIAIEGSLPAARLLDLDVFSPEGITIDRHALQLPPRPCLCCGEPARDCVRAGRHAAEEVVAHALDLIATFRAGPPSPVAGGWPLA